MQAPLQPLAPFKATKTLTFANTGAGNVSLFTVTGDVYIRMVAVCTTDVASAAGANVSVGTAASTAAIIASTLATDLDAREIWHDNSPDSEIEAISTMRDYLITDGNDVVIALNAQVDSGVLAFYCYWLPLSSDGMVVAA